MIKVIKETRIILVTLCLLAGPLSGAPSVLVAGAKLSLESSESNTTLEKRGSGWLMTSQLRSTKRISTQKIDEASEVARVDTAYDDIRDWALAIMPSLHVHAQCQDVTVSISGAFARRIALCSKIQAHRVFAQTFQKKILAVSR